MEGWKRNVAIRVTGGEDIFGGYCLRVDSVLEQTRVLRRGLGFDV